MEATLDKELVLEKIKANRKAYDDLIEMRRQDVEDGTKHFTNDYFVRREKYLNQRGIDLHASIGINVKYGEAILCNSCKKLYPVKAREKHNTYVRCNQHKGDKEYVDDSI